MAVTPVSRPARQFSLRRLLVVIALAALVFTVWRLGGVENALAVVFAALSVATLLGTPKGAQRAYVLAWSAVYGPSLAMACYATLLVACDHCQRTAWKLVPAGPGLAAVELLRAALRAPPGSDAGRITLGLLASCGAVAALALVGAKRPLIGAIAAAAVCAASAAATVMILALIRA